MSKVEGPERLQRPLVSNAVMREIPSTAVLATVNPILTRVLLLRSPILSRSSLLEANTTLYGTRVNGVPDGMEFDILRGRFIETALARYKSRLSLEYNEFTGLSCSMHRVLDTMILSSY